MWKKSTTRDGIWLLFWDRNCQFHLLSSKALALLCLFFSDTWLDCHHLFFRIWLRLIQSARSHRILVWEEFFCRNWHILWLISFICELMDGLRSVYLQAKKVFCMLRSFQTICEHVPTFLCLCLPLPWLSKNGKGLSCVQVWNAKNISGRKLFISPVIFGITFYTADIPIHTLFLYVPTGI